MLNTYKDLELVCVQESVPKPLYAYIRHYYYGIYLRLSLPFKGIPESRLQKQKRKSNIHLLIFSNIIANQTKFLFNFWFFSSKQLCL